MSATSWRFWRGPQPKISRHLAYLRSAGIVAARRDGKSMRYWMVLPPHVGAAQILKQTLGWLREARPCSLIGRDSRKLVAFQSKYALLEGAPLPTAIEETSCEAC